MNTTAFIHEASIDTIVQPDVEVPRPVSKCAVITAASDEVFVVISRYPDERMFLMRGAGVANHMTTKWAGCVLNNGALELIGNDAGLRARLRERVAGDPSLKDKLH